MNPEYDETLEIAIEQMELQRLLPTDRRKYLSQWFGVEATEATVIVEHQLFEMGQGELL
jgi:hypothetical protein